jgi:hypothetical protein
VIRDPKKVGLVIGIAGVTVLSTWALKALYKAHGQAIRMTAGRVLQACRLKESVAPTLVVDNPKVVLKADDEQDNPHRIAVRLGVTTEFDGTGTLTSSADASIEIYTEPQGGALRQLPLTLSHTELNAGRTLYIQGIEACDPEDPVPVTLTLALQGGTLLIGDPAADGLLCVEFSVTLKLSYKDPEGIARVFPEEFPVIVKYADESEEELAVGAKGLLSFNGVQPFTLRFETAEKLIASEPPGHERLDELKGKGDFADLLADGKRAFLLPAAWSLANSDWSLSVGKPIYAAGRFDPLQSPDGPVLGTPSAPVEAVLDPHWQYLRFVYYDRFLKGSEQISIPPLPRGVRGVADAESGSLDAPEAWSNWTVGADRQASQCLPWIVQDPPKPDAKVLLSFGTEENTFVETQTNGKRELTQLEEEDATTPSADRLRFYDLPTEWRSKRYFARKQPKGSADGAFFEDLTAEQIRTSRSAPLIFSLDDVVLYEESSTKYLEDEDQWVLLFSHTFSAGASLSAEGIFKPAAAPKEGLYPWSDVHVDRFDDDSYVYFREYPDWTRLIVAAGLLFEVFDQRTSDADEVVGARAAVLWYQSREKQPLLRKPFVTVRPWFRQEYVATKVSLKTGSYDFLSSRWAPQNGSGVELAQVGRFELALLRCCDAQGTVEKAVVFQYLKLGFDFTREPPEGYDEEDKQHAYVKDAVSGINKRWNGPDPPYNPGPATLEDEAGTLEAKVVWLLQGVKEGSHFTVYVKEEAVRSHMSMGTFFRDGEWSESAARSQESGWFTGAHESGHAWSFPDEYTEKTTKCSYHARPIQNNNIPGDPYEIDGNAMMNSNRRVRARYFWHIAEWLGALLETPMKLRHGGYDFSLPVHPDNDPEENELRSFVNWPLSAEINATDRFDIYFYALGHDELSAEVLKPGTRFDGLVLIVLKIKFRMQPKAEWATPKDKIQLGTFGRIKEALSLIELVVNKQFAGRWKAKGTVGDKSFGSCFIRISPRFLVETVTDENIKENVTYKNEQVTPSHPATDGYGAKVGELETNHGCHLEVEIVEGELDVAPTQLVDNVLELNLTDFLSFDRFLALWIGLAPPEAFEEDLKDETWKGEIKAGLKTIVENVMTDVEISDLG